MTKDRPDADAGGETPGSKRRSLHRQAAASEITAFKRLAEEYAKVFDLVPALLCVAKPNGSFLHVNPEFARVLGFSTDELIKIGYAELIHPDDREPTMNEVKSQLAGNATANFINRYRCKDGSYKTLEWRATPVTDGLLYAAARDITQRMRGELERDLAAGFLGLTNWCQSPQELIHTMVRFFHEKSGCEAVGVRLERDGDYPYWETKGFSREFVKLEDKLCLRDEAGAPVRDSGGSPVIECMCGNVVCGRFDPTKPFFTEFGSFWTNSTTELLASTNEKDRQARTRNRCNGEGYESVALVPLHLGEQRLGLLQLNDRRTGMFTAEDIAMWERLCGHASVALARLQMREALAASEQRYRSLFENVRDGIAHCQMLWDDRGRPADFVYLRVNDGFARLTGLRDVTGEKVSAVIPGIKEANPELFEIYGRVAATGKPESFEIFLKPLEKWLSVSAHSPAQGQFVATFDDITERRRTEEHLRRSQKLEVVGRLAGGVAHDFNNIVTAIIGNCGFLLEDIPKSDPCRTDVEEIRKAAERAADLTRQLLAFSRRQILHPKTLDLNVMLTDLGKLIRRIIGEDVGLTLSRAKKPALVHVDPGQMELAIMNLAINARRAMPKGGRLTLATIAVEFPSGQALGHGVTMPPGRYVLLTVADTGSGIDAQTLEHIFEPFFTTQELGRGTGLGLSTVYGVVKQSGGFIDAQSELGKGTIFKVFLPVAPAMSPEGKSGEEDRKRRWRMKKIRRTILLVEDEVAVLKTTARILKSAGYAVLDATSAEGALAYSGEDFELLLTDIVLPGMSGMGLEARLKKAKPDIKVVYMSGYADNPLIRDLLSRPQNRFLQKPFTAKVLLAKVKDALL